MRPLRILIADDETPARFGMRRALTQPDYEILEAEDGKQALEMIQSLSPDLVFLDLNMPRLDGQSLLRELGAAARERDIIVVTANSHLSNAVDCVRLGAADFIAKPFEVEQVRAIARRVHQRLQLQHQVSDLQLQLDGRHTAGAILGISRPMRQLSQQMIRMARAPADLLIRGESGSGKELIARELHRLGTRPGGPFIAVNTAAIPESLTESELFGHRKGAFTGADRDRTGVFEQAHGGTLFLDEIGDMPLPAQVKILRVLQERVVQPVGSSQPMRVDVRIVSATHQNLEEAVAAGRFRQDLYFRLKGIELQVPPLRSRCEDILLLANYFLERAVQQTDSSACEFTPDAIDAMLAHPWPGNVRELEYAVLSATAMRNGDQITPLDLGLSRTTDPAQGQLFDRYFGLPLTEAKNMLVADFERAAISAALQEQQGNVSAAARQLGMHRQSLQQKISQLELGGAGGKK